MAVNIRATRVAAQTAGGTQDITISGFGTPKAALFIATWADTDGVKEDFASVGIGATDGTNQWATATKSDHGVGSTDTKKTNKADECIILFGSGFNNIDGEANFSAWITDGVRINWGIAPSKGWLLEVVLFGGDDLSAKVDTDALNATTQTYGNMGFEADVLICAGAAQSMGAGILGELAIYLGLVHNDGAGGVVQRCLAFDEANSSSEGAPVARMFEDAFAAELSSAGAIEWEASASNFTANGFDHQASANPGTDEFAFLGLKFTGRQSWVGTVDSPTATGNDSQTGPGFKPQAVLLGLSAIQAVDVTEGDADAGPFGISFFNETEEFCKSIAIEDAAATTNTQSVSDDQAVNLDAHDGTDTWDAAFVSMDANGWTLNFSATDGTARKWIGLAVEGEAAPAADFAPHGLRSLNDGINIFPQQVPV